MEKDEIKEKIERLKKTIDDNLRELQQLIDVLIQINSPIGSTNISIEQKKIFERPLQWDDHLCL